MTLAPTVPTQPGDVVDVTYVYDGLLNEVQARIDGQYNGPDTGNLFATDVLVRQALPLAVSATLTGTVLGTFDPTTVETEVASALADYVLTGGTAASLVDRAPSLGGSRNASALRDYVLTRVPGIASLAIPQFCRASVGSLVEVVDVPVTSYATLAAASQVVIRFT